MSTLVTQPLAKEIENVLIGGDLGKLTPDQRVSFYNATCESLGLNPLTKPFQYITLNNKMTLYATKDCTEQLRSNRTVSLKIVAREVVEGCYVVTAQAAMPSGRCDESIGAVPIENLKGESRSNAMMKAETKAKRRVTLSICGLGMLDESEVDSIPNAVQGSRDAQIEVRDAKLALISSGKVEEIKAAFAPSPDRVVEIIDEEDAKYEREERAAIQEEPPMNPALPPVAPLDSEMLKAFRTIKSDLKKATGNDELYYKVLGNNGFEKSNQITNRVQGGAIYKALLVAFKDVMAKIEEGK